MGKLVLLASYPKSGNTWVRAFLTAIWNGGAVDINRLMIKSASSRAFLDAMLGVSSVHFTAREIARMRPDLYGLAARRSEADKRPFIKIHDAWLSPGPGIELPVHDDHIDRILYIVRDPRDVAISLARHLGTTIDGSIAIMADTGFWLSSYPQRPGQHTQQFLSSWSAHVDSWLAPRPIASLLVRYEDLLAAPRAKFAEVLDFLRIKPTPEAFELGIQATRFEALQRQEEEGGFVEKPAGSHLFFHGGRSRTWESILTDTQAGAIAETHATVMGRLGYAIQPIPRNMPNQ